MMTPAPIESVLSKLKGVKKGGRGWTALCPVPDHGGHGDQRQRSLSVGEGEDGRVLLKCFVGCRVDAIAGALGLQMSDLFRKTESHRGAPLSKRSAPISVASLAVDKALPEQFLRSLGVDNRGRGIRIRYRMPDGRSASRHRVRTALVAKYGSHWDGKLGVRSVPYGLWRLGDARKNGCLVLVEGESDCWTCWYHQFPALGIPGSEMVNRLEAEHLEGIVTLYVLQEPDEGGTKFVRNVVGRLRVLGWAGTTLVVNLKGVKDPNDLHRKAPKAFPATFRAALDAAQPPVLPGEVTAKDSRPDNISHISLLSQSKPVRWPRDLAKEAFYGLAGQTVCMLEPHTEADPAALLTNLLVAVGNMVGSGAHVKVGSAVHSPRLFAALVGDTSKARKGTSWSDVLNALTSVDPKWEKERITEGLSSGEGLIWAVRDPIVKQEPVKKGGQIVEYEEVIADKGISDKRLMVVESEFARVLRVMTREGNTLSAVIRGAWDSGNLRTLTKNNPARASGVHISILAHITVEELHRNLVSTETSNGFANRFLWVAVRRSKALSRPKPPPANVLSALREKFLRVLDFARKIETLSSDENVLAMWDAVYPTLSDGQGGMVGSLLARAEAQVLRLCCAYAIMDSSEVVRGEHLLAALAVWERVEESVRFIFEDRIGDPVEDDIVSALARRPRTQTELSSVFARHLSANRIARALERLARDGKILSRQAPTSGRPATVWELPARGERSEERGYLDIARRVLESCRASGVGTSVVVPATDNQAELPGVGGLDQAQEVPSLGEGMRKVLKVFPGAKVRRTPEDEPPAKAENSSRREGTIWPV